jgi:hypothetical protein
MSEEYYVKIVLGKWFDPRIKKVVEVYALTHEMTQEPIREKILILELLKDYSDAGSFHYFDYQKEEYVLGMTVYPEIKVGSESTRKITNDTQR